MTRRGRTGPGRSCRECAVRSITAGLAVVLFFASALVGSGEARACATARFGVAELTEMSGQVIECRVASVRSYWTESPRRILSEVTLEDVAEISGRPAARRTRTLIVPGGTVGDTTMRLCCAPNIEAGERWVLFLLPEYRTYPTVGMAQGMFRVRADGAGVDRVYSAAGRPLTEFDGAGLPVTRVEPAAGAGGAAPASTSPGVTVRSVRSLAAPAPVAEPEAMTLANFRQRVTAEAASMRAEVTEGEAGRRVEVDLRAVPLRAAVPGADAPERRTPDPARREPGGTP